MALIVITGGARSGKSGVAQRLASAKHGRVTVAVFGSGDDDEEFTRRIARHRVERSPDWSVIEADSSGGWIPAVPDSDVLVVDCLGTLLGRIMMEQYKGRGLGSMHKAATLPDWYADAVEGVLAEIIAGLARRDGDTIIVTNEVGDGVVPTYATGRVFRDVLGRANRGLAEIADGAYLIVAGRCVDLTHFATDVDWPKV